MCGLKKHKLVTEITYGLDAVVEKSWCKVCGKSLEEIEDEETPQNPEYRFKHLSEEPIG